jgi:hypothetical protein
MPVESNRIESVRSDMRPPGIDEHTEHRRRENQRVVDSATLAEKFPKLKALVVDLVYSSADSATRSTQIKYTVNVQSAKSVFRFDCPNRDCVRGDFDLSEELAVAMKARRKIAGGQKCCEGWVNEKGIPAVRCTRMLRYQLTFAYK